MQILIRTTEELKCILQKEAKRIGITLNALILQILWEWVKKTNAESAAYSPREEPAGRKPHKQGSPPETPGQFCLEDFTA